MSDKYTPKWCAEECVEASREIAALRTALAASEAEVAKVNHEGVRCREDLSAPCGMCCGRLWMGRDDGRPRCRRCLKAAEKAKEAQS